MNILELSQKRFSVRKYSDTPVSEEDLQYILEVTRMATIGCQQTAMEVCYCEVG